MSVIIKYLGTIAAVLLLYELAGPSVDSLLFKQCESNRQALRKISQQLRTKELALRQAEATAKRFEQRLQLNFEPDHAKAQVLYQEFLVRLSDACDLKSVMINCSQPERLEELGFILHYSLQSTGTTEQFGKLIDGFYKTSALHRVTHLSIFQSLGPDAPVHSLTMDIALLVLSDTTNADSKLSPPPTHQLKDSFASVDIFRRRLTPITQTPTSSVVSGMEMLNRMFNGNSARPSVPSSENSVSPPPFEEPLNESVIEPQSEEPKAENPKASLRLVGIIQKGEKKYAIFFDMGQNVQHRFTVQSSLQEVQIDARITHIQDGQVRLQENNQQLELSLGELYSEAAKQ